MIWGAMELQVFIGIFLLISVSGKCPTNWVQHNESCYYFSHDTETWVDAKVLCSSVDAHLVTIDDDSENTFLQARVHFGSSYKANRAWIGLNDIFDEGTWIWDNENIQLQGYSNWRTGEPSNDHGDENCACVQDDGHWNDIPCHQPVHFVCEKELHDQGLEIIGK